MTRSAFLARSTTPLASKSRTHFDVPQAYDEINCSVSHPRCLPAACQLAPATRPNHGTRCWTGEFDLTCYASAQLTAPRVLILIPQGPTHETRINQLYRLDAYTNAFCFYLLYLHSIVIVFSTPNVSCTVSQPSFCSQHQILYGIHES